MSGQTAPSHTGVVIAGVLYGLSLCLVAADTGLFLLVGVAALSGVLFGGAGVLGTQKTLVSTSLASLLIVGAAVGLLVTAGVASRLPEGEFAPAMSPADLRPFVLLLGVFCTATGVTTLPQGDSVQAVARSLTTTGGLLVGLFGTILGVVLGTVPVVGWLVTPLLEQVLVPPRSPANPGSLVLLFGGAVAATGALVVRLPVPELVARTRRSHTAARLEQLSSYAFLGGLSAVVTGTLIFLALPPLWSTVPSTIADSLLDVSTVPRLRYVLLGLTGVAGCCAGLVDGVRRAQFGSLRDILPVFTRVLGGLVVLAGAAAVGFETVVETALGDNTPFVGLGTEAGGVALVVGAVFLGCVLLVTLVGAGSLLGYLGLLSPRSTGPVLSTSGVVVAVVAAGQITGVSALLFLAVGVATVAWDVATYSYRLAAELDHGSRKLELLHFGAVGSVALLSVGVVYGGLVATEALAPRRSPAAAIAALLGVLLLSSTLRT